LAGEKETEVELAGLDIDSNTLQLLLAFCEMHHFTPPPKLSRSPNSSLLDSQQDLAFLRNLNYDQIGRLLSASHALLMKRLKERLCAYIAVEIGQKDVVELSGEFGESLLISEAEEELLKAKYISSS
jgi:hypothetical protein